MKIICLENDLSDQVLIKQQVHKFYPNAEITFIRFLYDFTKTLPDYDVVITDLTLPDSYGPEIILKIRGITTKPIIVLSGVGGRFIPNEIITAIEKSGATIFLPKGLQGYDGLSAALSALKL